ncbi:MAG: universal stress protein [Chloroflexi bacterium]|nr:universal stress protein [Chloroflexota bacterium]
MYERLLVALDGSPAAERVLEHAEALATAFGSQITLLRATLSPEMVLAQTSAGDANVGQIAPTLDPDPVLEADHQTASEYLSGVAQRLRQTGSLTVNVESPEGPANTVIVERAAAMNASLILMTTHGRSGLGRMVFGSTADSVLRHATCPVLLVRIHDERPS